MGTPSDYLTACLALAHQERTPASLVAGARIDRAARVADSVLWEGASVGANAELVRCVVGAGAQIPEGASFTESVIVRAAGLQPSTGERLDGDLLVAPLKYRRTDG